MSDETQTVLRVRFSQSLSPAYNPEKELRLISLDESRANVWVRDIETGQTAFLGAIDLRDRARNVCRLLSNVDIEDETRAGPIFGPLCDPFPDGQNPCPSYQFSGCGQMEAELILLCWSWFEDDGCIGKEVLQQPDQALAALFGRHNSLLDESCLRVLGRYVMRRRAFVNA